MSENLMAMVIVMTVMGAGTVIITTAVKTWSRTRHDRQVNELQAKVLEKLGSGQEVMQFVSSEAFQQITAGNIAEGAGAASRILNTMQNGVVMLCLGAGMLLIATMNSLDSEPRMVLQVGGGLVLAAGIGLAISAGWSYALLKKWGLLQFEQKPPQDREVVR
ncbi:MAG: hypothetical protein HY820_10315 [Acidobacteria bacterium]|nr:hypothetical protein [Acidobacteriota bacterium]